MYITNITDDYNVTLSINNKCTHNDNNIELIILLFTIIPCGMSLICLISPMVYTMIKPLLRKKEILLNNRISFFRQILTIIIIFIPKIHIRIGVSIIF